MPCSLMPAQERRRTVGVLVVPLLAITLSGCAGAPSVLSPQSPEARSIADLFWVVLAIAVAIFVVTETLLIVALVRYRHRRGAPEPTQTYGSTRLETAWTIAPGLILAGVFVATWSTMVALTQDTPGVMPVKVVGHQWWWEVQYPDLGITTATDIRVPVGQTVEVELVSADVIHSFWAPELAGKIDVIPGRTNRLRFTPQKAGVYRGQCAEYCGTQHANMGFEVIAEPRDQFDAWVQRTQAPAVIPTTGAEARGAEVFLRGICVGCHTIDGTAAQGKAGPNLTHFGSRRSIAALTLENKPEELARWLTNPQEPKPGNKMPGNLGLDPQKIQDLVAFLGSLK